MSSTETLLVVVGGVWLTLLTVALLALVRQISIVAVRIDRQMYGGQAPVDDGIAVHSRVATAVTRLLPGAEESPEFLLVVGGSCLSCQDLLREIGDDEFSSTIVALLSGRPENVDILESLVPPSITVVRDPEALEAVRALDVTTTPFVFEVRSGRVAAKTALRGADHLRRFVSEAETVKTSELIANLTPDEEDQAHAVS